MPIIGAIKKIQTNRHGQSMAEFALIFPAVILLTLIIIQLALIAIAQSVFNYATYAATRAGVVENPIDRGTLQKVAATICQSVDATINPWLPIYRKVDITKAQPQNNILEVEATFHYQLLVPFASGVLRMLDPEVLSDRYSLLTRIPHIPLYSRCSMFMESAGPP